MSDTKYDAIVVGSGPNGLAAAVRLAMEGYAVKVYEATETIGGGTRTKELMQPGHFHDICSAVHPLGKSSPFLRRLPLQDYGLEYIQPDIPVAHPLDGGRAAWLDRDFVTTIEQLGEDGEVYGRMLRKIVENWATFTIDALRPLSIPGDPALLASFGMNAIMPVSKMVRRFKTEEARALFAGIAAHGILPLDKLMTSAIGLVLAASAHSVGWPIAKGGSQSITNSLAGYLKSMGGKITTGIPVTRLSQLPKSKVVLFDLTPRQVSSIVGLGFTEGYRRRLARYRYGQGAFKVDYILKEPVPWRHEACRKAGTLHLGGTYEEIAEAELHMSNNKHPEKPYVLVSQPSLFDKTRAPEGKHTLWAYCHVPAGSTKDMTYYLETQIERFAPGFRDIVEQRHVMHAMDFEAYNMNYIGGDINGGVQDIGQFFKRPVSMFSPYSTPMKGVYFCSSSTPPGGGVHGMCGFHAAETVLRREFGKPRSEWEFKMHMDQ
jgi:phytoene dehydrogenase-like protein